MKHAPDMTVYQSSRGYRHAVGMAVYKAREEFKLSQNKLAKEIAARYLTADGEPLKVTTDQVDDIEAGESRAWATAGHIFEWLGVECPLNGETLRGVA